MDDLELIIGGFINLFIKNSKDLFSNRIDSHGWLWGVIMIMIERVGHFKEMYM